MNLKENEIRNFTFKKNPYIIKEIIEPIDFNMNQIWDSGICPHCKERITKIINHKMSKIEILIDNIKKDNFKIDDIVVLGFATDNRLFVIEKDKYKEIFSKSKSFKHMISEVI